MDTSTSVPKTNSSATGQTYSYKPVNVTVQGNTQPTQYIPGSYSSGYNKSPSDPKSGNVLYQSQEGQIGNTYTPKSYGPSKETASYGTAGTNTGGYRPNNASADTTTITVDNQSNIPVNDSSRQGSMQIVNKQPADINVSVGTKFNYTPGSYQSRVTTAPSQNVNSISQNQPTTSITDQPSGQKIYPGQSEDPAGRPKAYNPTPSSTYNNNSKPQETRGNNYNPQSNTSDLKSNISGSYQLNVVEKGDLPQPRSDGTRTYTSTNKYNPSQPITITSQPQVISTENQRSLEPSNNPMGLDFLMNKNIGARPTESFTVNEDPANSGQNQPVFTNTLFKSDVINGDMSKYPNITVTGHQERNRPNGGELAKSVVDVQYQLPEWYERDKDTGLIENMYLIDQVRFSNRKLLAHSPSRGTLQDPRSSQLLGRTHPSPSATRNLEDRPNFSHKIETPKSIKKWDRHLPRVILFVSKYKSGEMEDDVDNNLLSTPRRDYSPPKHSSPYYLENHQKVYHENPTSTQSGPRNQLSVGAGSNEGYFDYQEYKAQNPSKKEAKTDMEDFEEDEGVRQTVRVADVRKRRR